MERSEVIKGLKQYFKIQELVCPDVYKKFGDNAWNFFDTRALETLLVIRRDIVKCGVVINDYVFGGKNTQRGLRCNLCALVKSKKVPYVSQHILGRAFDVVCSKMTAATMRRLIHEHEDELPYPIRIEADVTWLHFDVMPSCETQGKKIYEFKG